MDLVCLAQWAKSGGSNPAHCHFHPTNPLVADVMLTSALFLIKLFSDLIKEFNKCYLKLLFL
jgi:hypothetical protein